MVQLPAGREANATEGADQYTRHHPEQALLYALVEEYYPAFVSHLAAQGMVLPKQPMRPCA